LKNGGVPGHLIDYIELFVDQNKKYFSCLISYSEKDRDFAHKIFDDLQAHGVRCWLAPEKLRRRDRKHGIIGSAINLHDKMLMVLSENSINKTWVEKDYDQVVAKELRTEKASLIPISIDDAVKYTEQPWAVKMRRSRETEDFALWDDSDSYQEMFSRLLEKLASDYPCPDTDLSKYKFNYELEDFSATAASATAVNDGGSDLRHEFRSERRMFG
jgi:hypothetical protein